MIDLTTKTPPEVDELWAEAMEPAIRTQAALNEAERSLRRYQKAGRTPEFLTDRIAKLTEKLAEERKAGEPFDAEFKARGGWTRYLLVTNSNGHVHRGNGACPSLTPGKTLVSPLFELSGNDDEGVVTRCGHTACTKCFPDAPVANKGPKPGSCAGSGQYADQATIEDQARMYRPWGRCPVCRKGVSLTSTFKYRQHKAEGAACSTRPVR